MIKEEEDKSYQVGKLGTEFAHCWLKTNLVSLSHENTNKEIKCKIIQHVSSEHGFETRELLLAL